MSKVSSTISTQDIDAEIDEDQPVYGEESRKTAGQQDSYNRNTLKDTSDPVVLGPGFNLY